MDIAYLRVRLVSACTSVRVRVMKAKFANGYNISTDRPQRQKQQLLLGAQFPAQRLAAPVVDAPPSGAGGGSPNE
jgi:hypothetical protein